MPHPGTDPHLPPPADPSGPGTLTRLLHGSAVSVAVQALYLATRLLLTPVLVERAGYERYGFWSMLFVALGVLGVHRLGLQSAAVPLVARALGAGDRALAERLLRTTASCALGFALLLGLPLLVLAPEAVELLGVGGARVAEAATCLRITTLATLVVLVLGGAQSALEAAQLHPRVKLTDAACQALEAGVLLALLDGDSALITLSLAYAARLLLPLPLFLHWLPAVLPLRSVLPGRPSEARRLLRLGTSIQALGMVHLGVALVPRLVLAHALGLAATGLFEAGRKLVEFAAALPAQALGPLVPASAILAGRDARGGRSLTDLLALSTRFLALAGGVPLLVLALAADEVVHAWLGAPDARVASTLAVLAPAAWIHLSTGPASSTLRGLARPRLELGYALLWLLLLLVAVPLGVLHGGIVGGAVGAAIAQALASLCLLGLAGPALELDSARLVREVLFAGAGLALVGLVPWLVLAKDSAPAGRLDALARVLHTALLVSTGCLPVVWLALGAAGRRALASRFPRRFPRLPLRTAQVPR